MEYDSRPSGSSVSPLIVVVASVVATFIVGVVVYVIALAPQPSGNLARSNGVSLLPQPATPTTASTFSASQLGLTQGAVANQWLEEFIAFEQADIGEVMNAPLMPVDGDEPGSFMRMFDGTINPAPGHQNHQGLASIYVTPSGAKLLRLHQNFQLAPTPGLTVTLTSQPTLNSIDQLDLPYVVSMDIATLTAFKGETVITIPADLPADALQSVVFWSKPYNVLIAIAPLTPY